MLKPCRTNAPRADLCGDTILIRARKPPDAKGKNQRLPLVVTCPHLAKAFPEHPILDRNVANREKADGLAVHHDRQVTKAAFFQKGDGIRKPLVRAYGQGIGSHDCFNPGADRIKVLKHEFPDNVALGQDAHQRPVLHDDHRADIVVVKHLAGRPDGVIGPHGRKRAIRNDVMDRFDQHFVLREAVPAPRNPTLSRRQ
jgi:hypothetical protein